MPLGPLHRRQRRPDHAGRHPGRTAARPARHSACGCCCWSAWCSPGPCPSSRRPPSTSGCSHTRFGVVNWVLDTVGFHSMADYNWTGGQFSTFFVITLLIVWQSIPFVAVNLYAATTTIPRELYEAASAGRRRRLAELHLGHAAVPQAVPPARPTFLEVIWIFKAFAADLRDQRGRPGPAHRDPARLRLRRGRRQPALRHGRGHLGAHHPDPAGPDVVLPAGSYSSKRRTSCEAARASGSGGSGPTPSALVLFIGLRLPRLLDVHHGLQADPRHHHRGPRSGSRHSPTFEHFTTAVQADDFWTLVRNSLTVTLVAVALALLIALVAAFAARADALQGPQGRSSSPS